MTDPKIQRALISVSDKTGLTEFASGLAAAGVEIFSSGGTCRHLAEAGLRVRDVSEYTGFPEMMDGRLKTLHPKVHGGILFRRDDASHRDDAASHGILPFDLVVVNLYPFERTVARDDVTPQEAIEQIDIGGPTMVRAAAKNHAFVTIVTSANQYQGVLEAIQRSGKTSAGQRSDLARAAFETTARYDAAIARFFAGTADESDPPSGPPDEFTLRLTRRKSLRYGENPHQAAALYTELDPRRHEGRLASADSLGGKELSYNNLLDLDAAVAIVAGLPQAAAVVIKHNNPCGAASAAELHVAVERAFAGDPVSAFGSVVGLNRPLDAATAEFLCTPGLFVEAIVAPAFDDDAVDLLTTRPKWKNNVRLVPVSAHRPDGSAALRSIDGGFLWQQAGSPGRRPAELEGRHRCRAPSLAARRTCVRLGRLPSRQVKRDRDFQ